MITDSSKTNGFTAASTLHFGQGFTPGGQLNGATTVFLFNINELKENHGLSRTVYPAFNSRLDFSQAARNVFRCIRVVATHPLRVLRLNLAQRSGGEAQ
ncbi:MAG: hypothetical protein JNM42_03110 [Propionivibrio sp.]|uniref:hypothetical protein n=1 Tax=Propionivibrio sp. TaxID=2212460 RepID=UPI001A4BC384|nr:hypothetical protein [Propionivibrio sp.]MBL8413408.1 hypothetical protein [Propionivibrio sp.]